jgi:hypothetical protein
MFVKPGFCSFEVLKRGTSISFCFSGLVSLFLAVKVTSDEDMLVVSRWVIRFPLSYHPAPSVFFIRTGSKNLSGFVHDPYEKKLCGPRAASIFAASWCVVSYVLDSIDT